MVVDRSSYSSGYKQVDMLVAAVPGDRGIRVLPLVPWVP